MLITLCLNCTFSITFNDIGFSYNTCKVEISTTYTDMNIGLI